MKTRFAFLILSVALFLSCSNKVLDYTEFVNPFIGTDGHGHTFPGATYPFGMVQLSPDTRIFGWDACSGYHNSDSTINGFSHTHLSGTGCADYGDILVMPIVGNPVFEPIKNDVQTTSYASSFSKKSESALPGYYSVMLDRYKVKAELTATERAGFHQYTFPASDSSKILIDLDYSVANQKNIEVKLEKVSDTEIRGMKITRGWAPEQYIYFYAKISKPFRDAVIYQNDTVVSTLDSAAVSGKILLAFDTKKDEIIQVKVGISAVDMDGARKNLEKEIPAWNFDEVKFATRKAWNDYLKKIDVQTEDKDQRTVFYTAMYHAAVSPNVFSDVDGRYRGMDKKIYTSTENVYTVFSLWDTMRALHPYFTIIDPDLNQSFIRTLLMKHKEGGILPMWELAANYTGTMIGYNAVPVIVDAYAKGDRNFDLDLAYQALLKTSNYDTANIIATKNIKHFALMPVSKKYKNELGYIPYEKEIQSVSKGLEYAYDDWCILQMAKDRKDTANIAKYEKLAGNYKNYYDPVTGFMRGKGENGKWKEPFNPRGADHYSDVYTEGTAWQWLWFVPHDINGLVHLLGGKDRFIKKLDQLFKENSAVEGELAPPDISGLIGQYAHGNEPSHHIIHLYNYLDQPHKTQLLVDSVIYSQYHNNPDGISGNEDCGQMSAWYLLNSMGFYQVCPGNPVYSIGRPIFNKVTLNLPKGKVFEIIAKNNSRKNKYIQSVSLNGKKLEKPFFTHAELMAGGKLEFVMGDTPKDKLE